MPIDDDERSPRLSNLSIFRTSHSQNNRKSSTSIRDGDHIPAALLLPHHRHSRMW